MTSLSFTAVCIRRTLDWSLQTKWLVTGQRTIYLAKRSLSLAHLHNICTACLSLLSLHSRPQHGLYSRLNVHQLPEVVRGVAGVPGLSHVLVSGPCHLDLVSPCCRLILLVGVKAFQP